MPKLSPAQVEQRLRLAVWQDSAARAVRWLAFTAAVVLVVAPVAWRAWERLGLLGALVCGGVFVWLAAGVLPEGPSLRERVRQLDDS